MNYKWKKENPIEMIRMAEKMSQKDFAKKLGYPGKDQYSYNMRQFTQDIIDKIKIVYERDIVMDIISHIKCENRSLKKQCMAIKKQLNKTGSNDDKGISSLLDKI